MCSADPVASRFTTSWCITGWNDLLRAAGITHVCRNCDSDGSLLELGASIPRLSAYGGDDVA